MIFQKEPNMLHLRIYIFFFKKSILCYLSWTLQVLSGHRQGGDKHGDAAQHEDRPHEAAQTPQKDGPTSSKEQLTHVF